MLRELEEKEDQEAEYLKEVEKPQVDEETALAESESERQHQAMEIQ